MELVRPAPEARAPPALVDHLLEEIVVRIRLPDDLVRASAACKAFRRHLNDPDFLRRYRSLHPTILLGFVGRMSDRGFLPAAGLHPNAPTARGFAAAVDFTYSHIPDGGRWSWAPYDARDGRVLLMISVFDRVLVSPKLAVCDPLTREYTLLPPIPDDMLASVLAQVPYGERVDFYNAFFDPSGGNEEAQFRVMCCMRCLPMATVFVYSSVSSSWTHCTSIVYAELGLKVQRKDNPIMGCHSYAYGSLYWDVGVSNKMIKLDINSMEFTIFSLPADHENRYTVVVEAGEGKIGIFSLCACNEKPALLRYSIRKNESKNANDRLAETTIPMPCEYDIYHFYGAAKEYIFLMGQQESPSWRIRLALFSLEIKTSKIEKICSPSVPHNMIPYFGYPPFLLPRRI